jgi:hypothetical protein
MDKFNTTYLAYMNKTIYANHHDGVCDNLMTFPLEDY